MFNLTPAKQFVIPHAAGAADKKDPCHIANTMYRLSLSICHYCYFHRCCMQYSIRLFSCFASPPPKKENVCAAPIAHVGVPHQTEHDALLADTRVGLSDSLIIIVSFDH